MREDEIHARMTKRQRECARLLITGHSTDATIAKAMGIKVCTMRRYIAALLDVTGMSTRVELALFIVRHPRLEQLLHNGPDYVRLRSK